MAQSIVDDVRRSLSKGKDLIDSVNITADRMQMNANQRVDLLAYFL